MTVTFPPGKYYGVNNQEHLTHEDPEEVITTYLEDQDEPILEAIQKHGAITVTAYNPATLTEEWLEQRAQGFVFLAVERFQEEFCNASDEPDDPSDPIFHRAYVKMLDLLRELYGSMYIYDCVEAGSVTLTPEQTEEIMREFNPGWFTEVEEKP